MCEANGVEHISARTESHSPYSPGSVRHIAPSAACGVLIDGEGAGRCCVSGSTGGAKHASDEL